MKTQIERCISNPDKGNRIETVLQNFTLPSLSQSGISVADMDALIACAEDCLDERIPPLSPPQYRSHLLIRKLGKSRQKKDSAAADKMLHTTAKKLARILCAYREDITFSVTSCRSGMGRMDTRFFISSESDRQEPLLAMIRSAYGKAETELTENIPDFQHRMYATGSVVFLGKEAEKQSKGFDEKQCTSWITAVLSSVPSDGNYTVRVRFVPFDNAAERRRRLELLNDCYRNLRFYGDLNWSNSVNMGLSVNEGQNVINATIGTNSTGSNSGYSMNLAGRETHKKALQLSDSIEHTMQCLAQAGQMPPWAVQISISANTMDTLQSVSSILSGTLSENGFSLRWSANPAVEPIVAYSDKVLPLMMFPTREYCGFGFSEIEEFSLVSQSDQTEGFQLGNILWNGTPFSPFWLSPGALSRHAFICGMTGSGKTNTLFKILEGVQLPFCVIEPVKGEYRALKSAYPNLKVWTMKVTDDRDPSVQVMRINPFWFPEQGSLAFHIDSIKTIIASSFELTAAMPNILEQCLYNIYVKAGWDLVTNQNVYAGKIPQEYLYPTFSDLCSEIETYLNNSDFSGDLMGDYKGALLSRLKSFVNGYKGILLNTNAHPDYSQIMNGCSVLELEGLADDADKCLVMGTILVQYYQYLKLHFKDDSADRKLHHLLVIEEAHRLFKNNKNSRRGDGGPDPTGQLVDSLSNMMAEIRAFGEGMLIVDQSPTKIAEDVIKNSATKIVHRIDNSSDIKVLQSSMLLQDDLLSFASLSQGEALIRADRMTKPSKVKMLCSSVKEQYKLSSTFSPYQASSSPLAGVFIANSVLSDEKTCEMIQEKISMFLNCLAVFGMQKWYEITGDLICDILDILKERKLIDLIDYKMGVLFEIVSQALKLKFSIESKKDLGAIHMLVMRMLAFFRDRREGRFIKKGAVTLFQQYMDENVTQVLKNIQLYDISVREHRRICKAADLDEDAILSLMITNYIQRIVPIVQEDRIVPSAEELVSGFLLTSVSFSVQADVVADYYSSFEKLSVFLSEEIKE